MRKILQILIGLVLLLAPIYGWIVNAWGVGDAAVMLLKGSLVWGFILVGVVLVLSGIAELKS